MGISKAMMEKVIIAKSKIVSPDKTVICATRFGNVMASRGSVIPIFVEQIKSGQPITVTDPNMTRFLMSLEEAIELVVYAFKYGKPGDIMVKKAPAVLVRDLAQAVKELFNADNEVKIIGPRLGEKMHEILLTKEEFTVAEDLGDFFRVPDVTRKELKYNKSTPEIRKGLKAYEEYDSSKTTLLNIEQIKEKLLKLDYIQRELERFNKINLLSKFNWNEAALTK
jgi:UDP-glucose 4-epimerase